MSGGGLSFFSNFPRVSLEIVRGQAKHRVRLIRAPVYLIGTASDCDLVLGDPAFPELHTYLFITQEEVTARHLGEGPPLLVEGQQVESVTLHDRNTITTGTYQFNIRISFPTRKHNVHASHRILDTPYPSTYTEENALAISSALLRDIQKSVFAGQRNLKLFLGPETPSPNDQLESA